MSYEDIVKEMFFAVTVFLLLLILCGCAEKTIKTVAPVPTASSSSQNIPNWHYDLMKDGLYRTDQNSGKTVRISDQELFSEIILTDDWIYFNDNNSLYRMNNENKRELILNENCGCLSLNNGWLYYVSKNNVFKIKPDGSGKIQVLKSECSWMVLSDKYIFYTLNIPIDVEDYLDDGPPLPIGELHRVDLNGQNDVNIGVLITDLSAYKNIIYFSDSADNFFYSMNPETLDKTIVYKRYWIEEPCFCDDYVFFDSDHIFYRLSLTEGTITQLTKAFGISCRGVFDGYAYVDISGVDPNEDGLYRMKIDGVDLEKLK
ncbi:DUF5050 domain-containing protein [Oscillospiraceae bacterium WX1]